jgi:hypothetical protein
VTNTVLVSFSDEKASSMASAAPGAVLADGHSTASIIVTLLNNGRPVIGHSVVLQPRNGSSRITTQTAHSGQDGRATFLVSDSSPEVVSYDVVDDDISLTLSAVPQVAFTSPDRPAPVVTSMTPTTGGNHMMVTLIGTGLSGAVVDFGDVPAQTLSIDPQGKQIVVTAPGGSGQVTVRVITPGGSTPVGTFTYDGTSVTAKSVHQKAHRRTTR